MQVAVVSTSKRISNCIIVGSESEAVSPDILVEYVTKNNWKEMSYSAASGFFPTERSTIRRAMSIRTDGDLYFEARK